MEQSSNLNSTHNKTNPKQNQNDTESKLQNNEIGIKSELKGTEIKKIVDRAIDKLVYKKFKTVILKARGQSISKLISIIDIIRSKILGVYVVQKTYSTKFKSENDNSNKEIKLPSMDAILSLEEPTDKTFGCYPPKGKDEMDKNYIDPKDPPMKGRREQMNNINSFRGRRGYHPGFRGRGRGRGRGTALRGRGQDDFVRRKIQPSGSPRKVIKSNNGQVNNRQYEYNNREENYNRNRDNNYFYQNRNNYYRNNDYRNNMNNHNRYNNNYSDNRNYNSNYNYQNQRQNYNYNNDNRRYYNNNNNGYYQNENRRNNYYNNNDRYY